MGLSKLQQQLKKKEKERKDAAKKGTPSSAAGKAKAAADAQAYICQVCRVGFPINAKSPMLVVHSEAKHPKLPLLQCWPQIEEMRAKEAAAG